MLAAGPACALSVMPRVNTLDRLAKPELWCRVRRTPPFLLRFVTENYGQEIRESAQQKARRIIREELQKLGWRDSDLPRRRKGDPKKLKMALRLRRETTMTLLWIAKHLHMGTKTHVSHLIYWHGKEKS